VREKESQGFFRGRWSAGDIHEAEIGGCCCDGIERGPMRSGAVTVSVCFTTGARGGVNENLESEVKRSRKRSEYRGCGGAVTLMIGPWRNRFCHNCGLSGPVEYASLTSAKLKKRL